MCVCLCVCMYVCICGHMTRVSSVFVCLGEIINGIQVKGGGNFVFFYLNKKKTENHFFLLCVSQCVHGTRVCGQTLPHTVILSHCCPLSVDGKLHSKVLITDCYRH